MMKINELTIGDWVLDGTTQAQITGITCDGEIETTFNEHSNIELIEPIPITQEILDKNEFVKEDNDTYVWRHESGLERIIWFDEGYTTVVSVRCDRNYEGHCYDVHELQHALKICGIRKEIVL